MSSFDRRTLICLPLALAACGFEPVYGPGGSARSLRGRVLVDPPNTPAGFDLVRQMEARLGRSEAPLYRLALQAEVKSEGLAVTSEQEITRTSLLGTADYQLILLETGAEVASGQVRGFTGFSTTGSSVATRAAEADAERRLMVILADQISTQLFAATQ